MSDFPSLDGLRTRLREAIRHDDPLPAPAPSVARPSSEREPDWDAIPMTEQNYLFLKPHVRMNGDAPHEKERGQYPVVSDEFLRRVRVVAGHIGAKPEDLLRVMASESGLRSNALNASGGATGLIQFMPSTARALGTTTEALRAMTPEDQLDYVEKYFKANNGGRALDSVGALYTATFWPSGVGKKADDAIVSRDSPDATARTGYTQNAALDVDGDGKITKKDLETWAHRYSDGLAFDALVARMRALPQ
jgi:hypothetical protein